MVLVAHASLPRRDADKSIAEGDEPVVNPFAYDIEGNDQPIGRDAALKRARKFPFIVAQAEMYGAYVKGAYAGDSDAMIQAHPQLDLSMYLNGTHMNSDAVARYNPPNDWFVLDGNGTRVRAGGDWSNNYLMDPLSGYIDWLVEMTGPKLERCRYNSLYVDELGVGPITSLADGIGKPIDRRTGQPWTWATWMPEMAAVAQRFSADFDVPIRTNGLGNGLRFFDPDPEMRGEDSSGPTSQMLPFCDSALAESFIRGATTVKPGGADYWPTLTALEREIRMLEVAGPKAWACSKIWITRSDTFKEQVHRFCLGTFMLGAAPGAAWTFTKQKATTVTPFHPLWARARSLGAPLGARNGLVRQFQHGEVRVDATRHDATFTIAT